MIYVKATKHLTGVTIQGDLDDFNDLVYYFNPLYVKIKKTIHEEKVKEIREENKRKRNEK